MIRSSYTPQQMLDAYDAVGRGGWQEPEALRSDAAAMALIGHQASDEAIDALAAHIRQAVDGSVNHAAQRAVEG